jgi:hypothetical protein
MKIKIKMEIRKGLKWEFIIGGSLNPIKKDCFEGVRFFITNHQFHELWRREHWSYIMITHYSNTKKS